MLFEGTPFELTRINLAQLLVTFLLVAFFFAVTRRADQVPGRLQNMGELCVNFVRNQIVDEVIGKAGRKFLPYLATLFFLILGMNLTGIVPGIHIPGTSVVAVPLVLAVTSYLVFNYYGIKANGLGGYLKANLFPSGVPAPIYILVTPIEFISTFVLRPVTLTIRLLANMLAGHLILALFFTATTYLLLGYQDGRAYTAIFGLGALGAGIAFTFFEALVAVLQAYIFTLLTAVYLAGSLEPEH